MSAPAPAPMGAPAPAVSSPIFPRTEEALGHRRVLVRSYSSIHRQHVAQVGERTRYAETSRPNPDENPERPVDNEWLRGAAFGDAVHKIFESIDFAHVRESASPEQMIERFADTKSLHVNCLKTLEGPGPDADAWLPEAVAQVARMVWNTLRTPLADAGVRLCDVSLSDRLHELEFFFPEVRAPRRDQDRYLGGVIDLVFRVADRYYLLDWKTNLLAGYDPDRLAQAMDLADYHRQYRLYLLALDRWAASRRPTGKDARPSRGNKPGLNVVGVYYLFLRGMNGNDESSGVFFHRPDAADIRLENIVPE